MIEDAAEEVDDPGELLEEQGAERDHDGAHDERTQDAPLEDPRLELGRHREVLEDQEEDEEVVHAERQLDDVPRVVLERGLRTLAHPEEHPEEERQGHQPGAPAQRLPEREDVRLPVQDSEVEDQEADDEDAEADPDGRFVDAHSEPRLGGVDRIVEDDGGHLASSWVFRVGPRARPGGRSPGPSRSGCRTPAARSAVPRARRRCRSRPRAGNAAASAGVKYAPPRGPVSRAGTGGAGPPWRGWPGARTARR